MSKKLTHPLCFPSDNVRLKKYESISCDQAIIYTLVSISNHFGNTNGGHYTATTRNWGGNGWSDRNDSHVTAITSSEATDSKAAYILFYEGYTNQ
jgi:ubiquitin C-terminal hydrolase